MLAALPRHFLPLPPRNETLVLDCSIDIAIAAISGYKLGMLVLKRIPRYFLLCWFHDQKWRSDYELTTFVIAMDNGCERRV